MQSQILIASVARQIICPDTGNKVIQSAGIIVPPPGFHLTDAMAEQMKAEHLELITKDFERNNQPRRKSTWQGHSFAA